MGAASIRAIIFDIGRVIVRSDVERAVGHLAAASSLPAAEVLRAIRTDPRWHDWQEGRMAPREWHQHLSRTLGITISFEQFCETWNRALDPAPILPDYFFASLSSRYKLALVSNTDPLHVAHQESNFSFFRYFPVRIYSCSVGVSKPHPDIYRRVLDACGVPASVSVYIDDVEAYVAAARQVGMHGIVFSSPEQLKENFRALDISVAEPPPARPRH